MADLTPTQRARLEDYRFRRANGGIGGTTRFDVICGRYAVMDGAPLRDDEAQAHRDLGQAA